MIANFEWKNIKPRQSRHQKKYDNVITNFLPFLSASFPNGNEESEANAVNTRYNTGTTAVLNPNSFA